MRKRFKLGMALGVIALGFAAAKPAQAAIVNPGFEDSPDFNGWTTVGNTTIQDSSFRVPAEGSLDALLSNGPGGATGGSAPVAASALDTFLGLSAGTIMGLGGSNGSAIKQTGISGNAGDTISFKVDFMTNEGIPSTFNDSAFVVIDGVITKLADTHSTFVAPPAIAGTDNVGINSFLTPAGKETGFLSGSVTLASGGAHTIGFFVINVPPTDTNVSSAMLVDALVQTPGNGGGGGVPLPAGMYVMPLALALAGAYGLKLRRTAAC